MKDLKKTGLFPTPTANRSQAVGGEALKRETERQMKRGQMSLATHVGAEIYNIKPSTDQLTLLPEASPAKTSPSPESKPESRESVQDYLMKSFALLASYDHATSSWRTSQLCLLETAAGGRDMYSEGLPKSGLMLNGTLYRLGTLMDYPLERHTDESGSGLSLTRLPTPRVRGMLGGSGSRDMMRAKVEAGEISQTEAEQMMGVAMWPTPAARDYKGVPPDGYYREGQLQKDTVDRAVHAVEGGNQNGQLNPAWVSLLMGLPPDWCDLEDE